MSPEQTESYNLLVLQGENSPRLSRKPERSSQVDFLFRRL